MKATILPNEISVVHSVRPEVNREYLTVNVPAGWDDVKKIAKKVLTYDGRKFTFTGWNSDTLQCYFVRSLNHSVDPVATISNK